MMNNQINTSCCAECGSEEGSGVISLKTCKACMVVSYCNPTCQKNHWSKHKKECKLRAAELRDEALFRDPPPKEDCPICFLPMPVRLLMCASLPDATRTSAPIYDLAFAHEGLANKETETNCTCCGKSICKGCFHSFLVSGNAGKCPYCNSDRGSKTAEEKHEEIMKRVGANDAASMWMLAYDYYNGVEGSPLDQTKAEELFARAGELGYSKAHCYLGDIYRQRGDIKKAKFHLEAAAMAGNEVARNILGTMDANSGNMERAIKHWTIAASSGCFCSMYHLITFFQKDFVTREAIDSILRAYNNSCAEMRSKARDNYIQIFTGNMLSHN